MKEFDEAYCDTCMCQDAACDLIENARTWIKIHTDLIGKRFFEDVAKDYPGAFRPFMMAWCEDCAYDGPVTGVYI